MSLCNTSLQTGYRVIPLYRNKPDTSTSLRLGCTEVQRRYLNSHNIISQTIRTLHSKRYLSQLSPNSTLYQISPHTKATSHFVLLIIIFIQYYITPFFLFQFVRHKNPGNMISHIPGISYLADRYLYYHWFPMFRYKPPSQYPFTVLLAFF